MVAKGKGREERNGSSGPADATRTHRLDEQQAPLHSTGGRVHLQEFLDVSVLLLEDFSGSGIQCIWSA